MTWWRQMEFELTGKPFETDEQRRARGSWVPWLLAQQQIARNTRARTRLRISGPEGREHWLTLSGFYALQAAEREEESA